MNNIPSLAYPFLGEFISSSGQLPFTNVGMIEKVINTNVEYKLKDFANEEKNNSTPYGSPSGVILRERIEKPHIVELDTIVGNGYSQGLSYEEEFNARMQQDQQWFEHNLVFLRKNHKRYVAIYNTRVIADDRDVDRLLCKVKKKYGPTSFHLGDLNRPHPTKAVDEEDEDRHFWVIEE